MEGCFKIEYLNLLAFVFWNVTHSHFDTFDTEHYDLLVWAFGMISYRLKQFSSLTFQDSKCLLIAQVLCQSVELIWAFFKNIQLLLPCVQERKTHKVLQNTQVLFIVLWVGLYPNNQQANQRSDKIFRLGNIHHFVTNIRWYYCYSILDCVVVLGDQLEGSALRWRNLAQQCKSGNFSMHLNQ